MMLSTLLQWRKLWKKRWIALHGSEIVYMEKEPTLENSADIVITKCQVSIDNHLFSTSNKLF